jgi:hypothetical protein
MELRRVCADPKCRTKFSPVAEWQIFCSDRCRNRVKVSRFRARQRYGDDDGPNGGKRQRCLFPGGLKAKAKPRKPPRRVPQPELFPPANAGLVATFGGAVEYGESGSVSDKNRYSVKLAGRKPPTPTSPSKSKELQDVA